MIDGGGLSKSKDQLKVIWYSLGALDYLHRQGLMHRDLKSDNIMLTDELEPVLIDFSVCKFYKETAADASAGKRSKKAAKKDQKSVQKEERKRKKSDDGSAETAKLTSEIGTATYIAPEVVGGDNYNEKSDVWSLGVIFSEVLTKEVVQAEKDKEAFKAIEEMKGKLKAESPMGRMLHGMLTVDQQVRFSCQQAMRSVVDLAAKAGFRGATAGRAGEGAEGTNAEGTSAASSGGGVLLNPAPEAPDIIFPPGVVCSAERKHEAETWCNIFEYNMQKTRDAVQTYCGHLEQIKHEFQKFDVCYLAITAGKIFEYELLDIWELDSDWDPKLRGFDPEKYFTREIELCSRIDWNFYRGRPGGGMAKKK